MLRDKLKHRNICEKKDMSHSAECPLCFEHVMLDELKIHYDSCYSANSECAVDALEKISNSSGSPKDFSQSSNQLNEDESSIPCPFCNIEFPISCLNMHKETCGESSENCENCVNVKEEVKHKETYQKKPKSSGGKLELCSFCKLPFEKRELATHEEACFQGYVVCPQCEIEVKKEDESAHKVDCPMKDMSNLVECYICYKPVMLNNLKNHIDICSGAYGSATGSVKNITHLCDSMDHSSHLSNQANKKKRSILINKSAPCPYCHKLISHDKLDYHKKYCREAIKTCPLCQENFHINDEKHHTMSCDALKNIEQKNFEYGDPAIPYYFRRQNKETKEFHGNKKFDSHLNKKCPFCSEWYSEDKAQDHMLKCKPIYFDGYSGSGAKPKKKNKNKEEKHSGIMDSVKKGFLSFFGQGNENSNPSSAKNYNRPDHTIHNRNNPAYSMEAPVMIPCEFCNKPLILNEEEILLHASLCRSNLCNRSPKETTKQPSRIDTDPTVKRIWLTGDPDDSLSAVESSQESHFSKETAKTFTFMTHFNKKYSLDNKNQREEDSKEKEIAREHLSNSFGAEKEKEKVADENNEINLSEAKIKENLSNNKEDTLCPPLLSNDAILTQSGEESPSPMEKNYETFYGDKDIKYTKPGEFLKDGYYYTEVNEGDYSNKEAKSYLSKTETIGSNDMNKIRENSYHFWETFDSDSDKSAKNKCYSENSDDCYVSQESSDKVKSHLSKSSEETGSKMIEDKRPNKTYHVWEKFDCNGDKSYSDNMNDYCVSKKSVDTAKSHLSKSLVETSSKMINKIKGNKTYNLGETSDSNTDESAGNKPDWKNVDNSNVGNELKSANHYSSYFSSSLNNHNSNLCFEKCLSNNECPVSVKNNSYKSSESMLNQYDSKQIESEDYSIIASSVMKGPIKIERLSIKKTSVQQSEDLKKVESSELITEKVSSGFNILQPEFASKQHSKEYPLIDFKENEAHEKREEIIENMGFHERFIDENLITNFERFNIHENFQQQNNVPYYEISSGENIHANVVPELPKSDEQPMDVDEENQDKKKYNILLRGNFHSKNNNFSDACTKENWENCPNVGETPQESYNCIKQDETLSSDVSDSENMSDLESYFQFLENKQPDTFMHNICQVCGNEICLCKIKASLSNDKSFRSSETSSKDDSIETVKNGNKPNHVKNNLNPVFKSSSKQISKASQNTNDKNWCKWRELDTESD